MESYEDLVKKLKPFSIVLIKLSDKELAKFKVVDDPNLIRHEKTKDNIKKNDENIIECEEEEEEIEIDITVISALNGLDMTEDLIAKEVSDEDVNVYSCFFCKQKCRGYTKAFTHYQLHINYFPFQCSVCDEANTDLNSFVIHCKKTHPELNKAKYINKFNSNCFNWIENYLKTQSNQIYKDSPQMYCPACEWIHLNAPDVNNPSQDTTQTNVYKPMQILRHIHEHILYKPFQCSICSQNGEDFRIHVLDYTVRKHFSTHHKELLDTNDSTPNWKFFNKKFTIAELDKFIANYLSIFGVKRPKKRYNKRKPKIESESVKTNSVTNQIKCLTAISPIVQNSNAIISMPSTSATIKPAVVDQLIANRIEAIMNPLLIFPSSNRLNMTPIPIESTDMGIICIDPKIIECDDRDFKYICVFCDDKQMFTSRIEASVHYAIHLNYYPVICLLCENKFIDSSALILHYEKEHVNYQNNLFHYVKQDEKIENWINGFLDFQKTHEFFTNVSVTYGDYCLICRKLSQTNGMKMKCEKNNSIGIKDHINLHLHYFPYKCLICLYGQRVVRFSSMNSCASDHFQKFHNLQTLSKEDNLKLLAKTDEIINLEKMIDSILFPNRDQKCELLIDISLKRNLDKMLENDKIIATPKSGGHINGLGNGLANGLINNNSLLKNSLFQNSILKVNGIKNLTPKHNSIESVEYIPNKRTYKEPFLLCFHCHTKVLNTSDLESHHESKHPKLTIASYSPTKMDVFTY